MSSLLLESSSRAGDELKHESWVCKFMAWELTPGGLAVCCDRVADMRRAWRRRSCSRRRIDGDIVADRSQVSEVNRVGLIVGV